MTMSRGTPGTPEFVGPWQSHAHMRNLPAELREIVPSGPKSYSSWNSHRKCGFQYAANKVWKFETPPEPPSPALDRGNRLHDSVENFFLGSDALDPDLQFYKQWMWNLRNDYNCLPEEKWAFRIEDRTNWIPVDFDDPTASVRGLFDLRLIPKTEEDRDIDIFEWKSGKKYDDHKFQRRLYKTASSVLNPDHNTQVTTVYFDQKQNVPSQVPYKAGEPNNIALGEWAGMFELMDMPGTYVPNPGFHCRWCPHSRYKGGKCRAG